MLRLTVALLLLGCTACGDRTSSASTSSTFIRIQDPKEGWAESIAYRTVDGVTELALNDVVFELRDPAAYRLDWDAVGMSGIKVTGSFHYQSNVPVEGALLSVSGRAVEIVDGSLRWGDEDLGAVAAGDRVVVDENGLRRE